jgi:hypothetical protein
MRTANTTSHFTSRSAPKVKVNVRPENRYEDDVLPAHGGFARRER